MTLDGAAADADASRTTLDGAAADANASRNARRQRGRRARWAPARDALWGVLDGLLHDGARVGIVGAGNGDDLPLGLIAARASTVALIDIDEATARRARGRVRRGLRRRVGVHAHDVTGGAADRIVRAATAPPGTWAVEPVSPPQPSSAADRQPVPAALPGGPYDLVIGDLLYSQLLYPALLDADVPVGRRRAILATEGAGLTAATVAVLHAAAPVVVHVHDLACWGNGYDQPVELDEILDEAARDLTAGLGLAARAKGPREADPRGALGALGIPVIDAELWRWPFTAGVDYLVVATVAGARGPDR